jgi:hypothetical protein
MLHKVVIVAVVRKMITMPEILESCQRAFAFLRESPFPILQLVWQLVLMLGHSRLRDTRHCSNFLANALASLLAVPLGMGTTDIAPPLPLGD